MGLSRIPARLDTAIELAEPAADRRYAVARTCQNSASSIDVQVRPQIPGLSPGGLGPHLTSSGSRPGSPLGFPFAQLGSFPSSAFFRFPIVRRSPVPSLRPSLPGSVPLGFLPVPFRQVKAPIYPLGSWLVLHHGPRLAPPAPTETCAPSALHSRIQPFIRSRAAPTAHAGPRTQGRTDAARPLSAVPGLRMTVTAWNRTAHLSWCGGSVRAFRENRLPS